MDLSLERETETMKNDCRKGEVPSYIALYNYLCRVQSMMNELKTLKEKSNA